MSLSVLPDFTETLAAIPPPLREAAVEACAALAPALASCARGPWIDELPRVFAASPFVARTCVQSPEVLRELIDSGGFTLSDTPAALRARVVGALDGVADADDLKRRLRGVRRREMVRIAWRDLARSAGLEETLAQLSTLADACIDEALKRLHAWAVVQHGDPMGDESGAPQSLVVLGMGKLGGDELNFSSDIDLIFCYAEEGETKSGLSNHEFFIRLGKALIGALSEATADGFVFRVDMRLRPNGNAGPLALSFDAMEHYYQVHGRDWERYAFLKARVVGGDLAAGAALLQELKPFMYRKYLDYGAIEAIRGMKVMIEREIARKGMAGNVKLGRGGIREIEFVAQALQLIRGGREPQLQERRLLAVLPRLEALGYLEAGAARELVAAYMLLRDTEHRLQMVGDQQTQLLPEDDTERLRLAFASGFADWPVFHAELERQRSMVHKHFARLFRTEAAETRAAPDALAALWAGTLDAEAAAKLLAERGYERPAEVLELLKELRAGAAYTALSTVGRERADRVMPMILAAAARSPDPHTTLQRLIGLIEAIGRRTTYFALMAENPQVLEHFVRLAGASPWIANWIAQHPLLLDELIDPRSFAELPEREALADELRQWLAHIPAEDLELQMEVLREFRHGHVLRVAAADTATGLPAERVGVQLAAIAEVVIAESLALATRDLVARHGSPGGREPVFAVIGYGKLGSLELGYSSDLDIIFLYDAATEAMTDGPRPLAAEQFYARLGQRLIHILTTRTPGGILYEVDMRLRPSGKSGPLVASLEAFREYQRTHAWTWEHQALVRARPIAGDAGLGQEFGEVRAEVLCRERDAAKLRQEVTEMRARMLEAKGARDDDEFADRTEAREAGQGRPDRVFDLKHERGGIVDIEFMVQYMVLRSAREYPGLLRHTDNLHLLQELAAAGALDGATADVLAEAYRRYLSIEHHQKLMERGTRIARAEVGDLPERVQGIWREMLEY